MPNLTFERVAFSPSQRGHKDVVQKSGCFLFWDGWDVSPLPNKGLVMIHSSLQDQSMQVLWMDKVLRSSALLVVFVIPTKDLDS